jgi:hypothetical protein
MEDFRPSDIALDSGYYQEHTSAGRDVVFQNLPKMMIGVLRVV